MVITRFLKYLYHELYNRCRGNDIFIEHSEFFSSISPTTAQSNWIIFNSTNNIMTNKFSYNYYLKKVIIQKKFPM